MKKMICMALALVMLLALGCTAFAAEEKTEVDAIKEAGVLVVALSPDFAPMEFVDSSKQGQDQYVGFDVTLAKYIAEYLGVELEIQAMSFDACQTAVAMDAVDMSISGYSWKEDRAENFELSDYYYAGDNETEQVLLLREEDFEKFTKPEDFAGVTVGAQNASLQQTLVEEQLPDANLQVIGEIGVGVMELQSGNIDALAVADGNADAIMANNAGLVKCSWEFDVAAEYEANVIMMHKGDTALLAVVNEALAEAYENGYYGPWYDEAKIAAGLETATEVSIADEAEEVAEEAAEEAEEAADEAAAG
ncbi:MAG: transporter substrate-binding domain-containing protein [Eubacteriales bacterium]|nr:transporter substrate-binding domain-containing protein [Eubacteriales bacterium]